MIVAPLSDQIDSPESLIITPPHLPAALVGIVAPLNQTTILSNGFNS